MFSGMMTLDPLGSTLLNKKPVTALYYITEFDPDDCPLDCSRPCEIVCPANAILGESTPSGLKVLFCFIYVIQLIKLS